MKVSNTCPQWNNIPKHTATFLKGLFPTSAHTPTQPSCPCTDSYYLPLSPCPQPPVPLGLSLLLPFPVLPPLAEFKFLLLQVSLSFYMCESI